MHRMAFTTMKLAIIARASLRILCFTSLLAMVPAFAADAPASKSASAAATRAAASNKDVIVSTRPMETEAEGTGVHGQLVVAPEILSPDTRTDLLYTITAEPLYGRVGLAGGGDEADFFKNKTSRLGYFAYRPQDGYVGQDSFAYTVRNETSGLVFKNTVEITVKPAPAIMLDKFEVGATRERSMNVRSVSLTTRPNTPVTQKVPSHEDFMSPSDRILVASPKVSYLLDEKAKSQNRHGQARSRHRPALLCAQPRLYRRGSIQVLYDRRKQRAPRRGECHFGQRRADPKREAHRGRSLAQP